MRVSAASFGLRSPSSLRRLGRGAGPEIPAHAVIRRNTAGKCAYMRGIQRYVAVTAHRERNMDVGWVNGSIGIGIDRAFAVCSLATFATSLMMLIDNAATCFTGKALFLRQQKSIHVLLCFRTVLYQIDIIILPIPSAKALYASARKAIAFKTPLRAALKSTSFFNAIPATFPSGFFNRRSATGTRLFAVQICATRKAVYTAWSNHFPLYHLWHFHKASPPYCLSSAVHGTGKATFATSRFQRCVLRYFIMVAGTGQGLSGYRYLQFGSSTFFVTLLLQLTAFMPGRRGGSPRSYGCLGI